MEIMSLSFVIFGVVSLLLRKAKTISIEVKKYLFIGGIVFIVSGIIIGSFSFVNGIRKGWNSYQESPRREGSK